jgi:hypothetical protein
MTMPVAKTFMKTLKREEVYANKCDGLENFRANIEEFIEQYYNQQRLHSALAIDLPKSSSNRSKRQPSSGDGKRILVDRLWPRGLTKTKAKVDLWLKNIPPSAALRK